MFNDEQMQRVIAVQQRYSEFLMRMPHVVGIGVGIATCGGQPTGELSLVVMVNEKLPEAQLSAEQMLPKELDGVRVDVQETGEFSAT
ncbi:MAG: hypothetical protein HXY40_10610 [Chloroflexi bacterium]|nr:hypothetical protein [Chloroflexota bacterium]